jgi:hypothetical protein
LNSRRHSMGRSRKAGEHRPSDSKDDRDHRKKCRHPNDRDRLLLLRRGQSNSDRQHQSLGKRNQHSHDHEIQQVSASRSSNRLIVDYARFANRWVASGGESRARKVTEL